MNPMLAGYTHTIGRRKTATARLYICSGEGLFLVNRRPWKEYFPIETLQLEIVKPFEVAGLDLQKYDLVVYVDGGGIRGQAEALRLAIARAIARMDETKQPFLRQVGLLTVDSRIVERKHYGHKKARRSFQFSKR